MNNILLKSQWDDFYSIRLYYFMDASLVLLLAVWNSAAPERILNSGSYKQSISCVCVDSRLVHCVNVNNHILTISNCSTLAEKGKNDSKSNCLNKDKTQYMGHTFITFIYIPSCRVCQQKGFTLINITTKINKCWLHLEIAFLLNKIQ